MIYHVRLAVTLRGEHSRARRAAGEINRGLVKIVYCRNQPPVWFHESMRDLLPPSLGASSLYLRMSGFLRESMRLNLLFVG